MCTGGRISNYLSRFLPKATTNVLFVGYQAQGTTGRDIQEYGPQGGYVYIEEQRIDTLTPRFIPLAAILPTQTNTTSSILLNACTTNLNIFVLFMTMMRLNKR
jgi:hypothetical protein